MQKSKPARKSSPDRFTKIGRRHAGVELTESQLGQAVGGIVTDKIKL